jgi:polyhydroxyalkanoate synthesis regulator phasin
MADASERLQELIQQLEDGEITSEEYERMSSELVDSIGSVPASSEQISPRRERIRSAEKMAKKL